MVHAVSLGLILFVTWLLLSGLLAPLLLILGILSCAAVVFIAIRMDMVDREAVPLHLAFSAPLYFPWLLWEIVKANIDVTRRVLIPSTGISPTMTLVDSTQRSELGLVIFANSITLTPGTISIDVEKEGKILVHAITREGAESLQQGEMDRRVTAMEASDARKAVS